MNRATIRRALGGAAVVAVTVGVTQEITARTPQPEAYQAPFPQGGDVGAPVRLREVEMTVLDVDGARAVVDTGGRRWTSAGVWVVAHVRLEVLQEPLVPGRFRLADGAGRVYERSERIESGFEALQQPGVPVTGAVVFEVPGELTGDLEVRLDHARSDDRGDARADVHVTVDDATWAAWRATESITVPTREVGR